MNSYECNQIWVFCCLIGLIVGFIYTALFFIWAKIEFLQGGLLFLYKTIFWPVYFVYYFLMVYITSFWLNVIIIFAFSIYFMVMGALIGWIINKIATPSEVEI